MNNSSELGITELFLQSVYVEKLQSNSSHSLIFEILPSPKDVVRVWKTVNNDSIVETTQDVFVTLINSYIEVSKEDVGSVAKIIVDLVFSPFPKISKKSLTLLSHYCDNNLRSFLKVISENHRFSPKSILKFHHRLIRYLLTDQEAVAKFRIPAFILVRTLMRFKFHSDLDKMDDEDDMNDDDGECLKEVILNVFDDDFDAEGWNPEDRLKCYYVLSGLSLISLEFARNVMPFLMSEVYFTLPRNREMCLSLIFEIIFVHPCLFTESEKDTESQNSTRKRKRKTSHESDSDEVENEEEEEEEDDDDDDESSKKGYGETLMNFLNGPTEGLRKVAIIGLARLLLGGPNERGTGFREGHEKVLGRLVKVYTKGGSATIASILVKFFGMYHKEKNEHQEEIANTVINIVFDNFDEDMEKLEEGVDHQIQFLMECLDKKVHNMIVENIKYNIENSYDLEIDFRVIQQWLHLR